MTNNLKASLFLLSISVTPLLFADSMRCGTKLVTVGDTATQVKFKCGRPYATEELGLIKRSQNKYAKRERIFYKPSQGKFLKILEFHNGKLVKIDYGSRI